MKTPEIVLQIRDGVLTHIATNGQPVKIILIDWDNIYGGDPYPTENSLYEPDYEFNDLAKYLEENKPKELKEITDLSEFFQEHGFNVYEYKNEYDDCAEISKHTKGGVEMIFQLEPFTKEAFEDIVNDFDVDDQIQYYWNDPKYKENFTIRQSLKDFEDFKNQLEELNQKLNR